MERTSLYGERSPTIGELAKALSKAQGECKNATRNCKGHFGPYTDLAGIIATIREPFSKNGLAYMQHFLPFAEGWVLVTELSHTSGEWTRSVLPINHKLDPQKFAASATYMKRIALSAMAGIAAEDEDDGETATRAAEHDRVAGQSRVAKMLEKTIRATKPEQMAGVMKRVGQMLSKGEVSPEDADRLDAIAREVAGKEAKPAARKEAAAAT